MVELGLILPLGGCTALVRKEVPGVERVLTQAGFQVVYADTPEKVARLQTLPPYKVVKRMTAGQIGYIYADPTNCRCVYVGTEEQYALYKQYLSEMSLQESDALEARMATEEQAQTLDVWDPL
jgi:hypothetical protein